jgi:hypothetical protein
MPGNNNQSEEEITDRCKIIELLKPHYHVFQDMKHNGETYIHLDTILWEDLELGWLEEFGEDQHNVRINYTNDLNQVVGARELRRYCSNKNIEYIETHSEEFNRDYLEKSARDILNVLDKLNHKSIKPSDQ